jgi:hypothetical protein
MTKVHKKGRIGEDGVMRYYDPSKHSWRTEQEIKNEETASKISIVMITTATVVLGGGGLLWMLIMALSG